MGGENHLGHFNLLQEIGRGGMGSVWRAFDPTLNRDVAVKILNPDLAGDAQFVTEFLQEARNAAAISHPHIVQVHLVDEQNGQYYIVMELLEGRSLLAVRETEGPLAEERALDIAIQVADALKAAYQRQMIHGDIKPANIFLTKHGAKVLDFGLAKLANVEAAAEGDVWGSPYYMSPERVGRRAEDFRSDIYSLGATLFDALAGRPPFDADNATDLALKRLNEKPPLLRALQPNLTTETERVVDKMLSKSPLMRFRDYDHLLDQLREAKTAATAARLGVTFTPEPAGPPPRATETSPPAPRSRTPLLIAAGAVAAIAIGAAVYFATRPNPPPPPPPTPPPAPTSTVTQVPTPTPPPPPPVVVTQTIQIVKPPPPPPPSVTKTAEVDVAALAAKRAAAEKQQAKAAETAAAELWPACRFADALARLTDADKRFTTDAGHKALQRPLLAAALLHEFKAQLAADFARARYAGAPLQTKAGGRLAAAPTRATDAEIVCASQYGELATRWEDVAPASLLAAGQYYAGLARAEPLETQSRRQLALAAFARQFGLATPAAIHANAAIQLHPGAELDVKLLFGGVPKMPAIPPPTPPPPQPVRTNALPKLKPGFKK
jgi:outer membrane biosynthesis protein TonB